MKDREGTNIKIGDTVASAITINQKRFSESFTIKVCKKNEKGRIILDGVWGWQYLNEAEPKELQIITDKIDLSSLCGDWISEFGERGYDAKYLSTSDAHDFYENVCEIIGECVYDNDYKTRKEEALLTLKVIVDKKIAELGPVKIKAIAEIMDKANLLKSALTTAIYNLRDL